MLLLEGLEKNPGEVSMNIDSISDSYQFLKLNLDNMILTLSIDRPKKLNALDLTLLQELDDAMSKIRQLKDFPLRGLIFTGSGEKAFIAGADIEQMSKMSPLEAEHFAVLGQKVSLLIEDLPFPVIAAVNGFALGGGCEMALSADFIFATRNAVFGQPEVKLGLIPGFGGTQRLAKVVGRNRAKEIIFSGRNLKVEEALEIGLVLKIFEDKESMMNESRATLELMSKNSPLAIAKAKKVMNRGNDLTISNGLELESEQFSQLFSSQDMKEGTGAFLEKRQAQFSGK